MDGLTLNCFVFLYIQKMANQLDELCIRVNSLFNVCLGPSIAKTNLLTYLQKKLSRAVFFNQQLCAGFPEKKL